MQGKGKQFVPHDRKVVLAFPGGAGYGIAKERDTKIVMRDLSLGYISEEVAKSDYGLSNSEIEEVNNAIRNGEAI